jgi:hypothetical protein
VKEEGVELAASDCCCRGDALRYCVKGMKKMKRCVRKMNEKKKRRGYRVWFCIFIKITSQETRAESGVAAPIGFNYIICSNRLILKPCLIKRPVRMHRGSGHRINKT